MPVGNCFQETPRPRRQHRTSASQALHSHHSPCPLSSKLRLRLGQSGGTQGPKAQPLPGVPDRGPADGSVPARARPAIPRPAEGCSVPSAASGDRKAPGGSARPERHVRAAWWCRAARPSPAAAHWGAGAASSSSAVAL